MLVQVGSCPHDYCWHSLEECNPDASNDRATYGALGNARVGAGVVGAAPGVGVRVGQRAHKGLAVRAVAARNAARVAAAVVVKVPALPAPAWVVVAARVVHAAPWRHPSSPVSVLAVCSQRTGRGSALRTGDVPVGPRLLAALGGDPAAAQVHVRAVVVGGRLAAARFDDDRGILGRVDARPSGFADLAAVACGGVARHGAARVLAERVACRLLVGAQVEDGCEMVMLSRLARRRRKRNKPRKYGLSYRSSRCRH